MGLETLNQADLHPITEASWEIEIQESSLKAAKARAYEKIRTAIGVSMKDILERHSDLPEKIEVEEEHPYKDQLFKMIPVYEPRTNSLSFDSQQMREVVGTTRNPDGTTATITFRPTTEEERKKHRYVLGPAGHGDWIRLGNNILRAVGEAMQSLEKAKTKQDLPPTETAAR